MRIRVVLTGDIQFRFNDDQTVEPCETGALDSFWGPEAGCSCPNCEWAGLAITAADAEDDFLRMLPYSDQELARLERFLELGNCPSHLVSRMNELCATIRRQTEIVRSLHRSIAVPSYRSRSIEGRRTPPKADPMGTDGKLH